jgi:long-chain acyl-CoA synthetase
MTRTEVAHERTDEDVLAAVAGQTIPRLFRDTVARHPHAVALRWRSGDGWGEWTWSDYAERACRTAALLAERGIGRGDRVALMLRNRVEFHPADMGAYLVGATPFSVYNSSSPEQIEYLLGHSEAKLAIVDADFVKSVEEVRDRLPHLRHLVVVSEDSADGTSWAELIANVEPVDLRAAAEVADPEDVATFIYTSGTTGPPKAVMLSHRNICWLLESLTGAMGLPMAGRRMLSYLPMAHVAERIFTHYLPAREGAVVTPCPDPAQVAAYLPEVRPEAFFGPPRIFEKMRAGLTTALSATPEGKAALEKGLELGRQVFEARVRGEEPLPEVQEAFAGIDAAVFAPVRAKVGFDACRLAFTGAAPPPVEVIEFFNFIGVPLAEVYGLSEDTGLMTTEVRAPRVGSVGKPIPGCTIRLLEDGEILCRGGHVFRGYFKDDEKTAEVLDADGWLHSGDIGVLDDDGYIRIVDRKKELIITAGGKNISPANIEAALKTIPLVGQACVIGDKRHFVTALLTLDPDLAGAWAAGRGIDGDLASLAEHPEVRAELEQGVAEVNERLSNVERVKKFAVLGDEWMPDSEVLTPTMKLKRRGVLEQYGATIDALYAE